MANQRKQGKSHLGGWIDGQLKSSVLDIARRRKVSTVVVMEEMCEAYVAAHSVNSSDAQSAADKIAVRTIRKKGK